MRDEIKVLAGSRDAAACPMPVFAQENMDFLQACGEALKKDSCFQFPEVAALAFWLRKSHLESMKQRWKEGEIPGQIRTGKGLAVQLTPTNVPTMFLYSFAISLLAGNSNIVRVSERTGEIGSGLCRVLSKLMERPEYAGVRAGNAFISYERNDALTEELFREADLRIVWGSDETVAQIRKMPALPGAADIFFPDRWSLAVLEEKELGRLSDEEMQLLVRRFYNDTYVMDQKGCSSPQLVLWKSDPVLSEAEREDVRRRFWSMLALLTRKEYGLDAFRAARKYEQVCLQAMKESALQGASLEKYEGNYLYVVRLSGLPSEPVEWQGGFGLFYEASVQDYQEIVPILEKKTQTIVYAGKEREKLAEVLQEKHAAGVDRIVSPGQALSMDIVWDGKDLIREMSRILTVD